MKKSELKQIIKEELSKLDEAKNLWDIEKLVYELVQQYSGSYVVLSFLSGVSDAFSDGKISRTKLQKIIASLGTAQTRIKKLMSNKERNLK